MKFIVTKKQNIILFFEKNASSLIIFTQFYSWQVSCDQSIFILRSYYQQIAED